MMLWFDERYTDCAVSLRRFLVDRRISVASPAMIHRILRNISVCVYWKASESKIWLLYYSISILKDTMVPKFFEHHKLLVFAITTLKMKNDASRVLNEYVVQMENLYGLRHMVSNVHLLFTSTRRCEKIWAIVGNLMLSFRRYQWQAQKSRTWHPLCSSPNMFLRVHIC